MAGRGVPPLKNHQPENSYTTFWLSESLQTWLNFSLKLIDSLWTTSNTHQILIRLLAEIFRKLAKFYFSTCPVKNPSPSPPRANISSCPIFLRQLRPISPFVLQEKKSVPLKTLSQTLVQTPNFFRSCDSFSMKKIKYYELRDKNSNHFILLRYCV